MAAPQDAPAPRGCWFPYWRTPPALWETELAAHPLPVVPVPLNWSFHADGRGGHDFGDAEPGADLARLAETAGRVGKEAVIALPLSPVPFLPDGGLPAHLAGRAALDDDGLVRATMDADGRIRALRSFFDPRVFHGFRELALALGRHLAGSGAAVCGVEHGHVEGGRFRSFARDGSDAFRAAFARCLERSGGDGGPPPEDGARAERDFARRTLGLYAQAAAEALGDRWTGARRAVSLGGSPSDFFRGLAGGGGRGAPAEPLFAALRGGWLPSTALLPGGGDGLAAPLADLVDGDFVRSVLDGEGGGRPAGEGGARFSPLALFDLHTGHGSRWEELSLVEALEERHRSLYRFVDAPPGDAPLSPGRLHFAPGAGMDDAGFRRVLRAFLDGARVVIDGDGTPEASRRRLAAFLLENSVPTEKVNFRTTLELASLGEGRLLLLEGGALLASPPRERRALWRQLLDHLGNGNVAVEAKDGVDAFWRARAPAPSELGYGEVRRLHLYNPTSYRRRVGVTAPRGSFAFLGFATEERTHVRRRGPRIGLELLPRGRAALDFGVVP